MIKLKGQDIDFKKILINYLKLASKYKKYYITTSIIVLLISLMDFLEKYIFKELIDQGTNFYNGTITQNVFVEIIIWLAIIFTISWIVRAAGGWIRFHLVNTLDSKMIFDLKKWFFEHIIGLSHNFHTTHRPGSLIARFTRSANAIETMTDFILFETLPFLTGFLVAFIPIIYIDPISGIILVITILVYIIYSLFLLNKRSKANIAYNIAEDDEKAHISDSFSNIETIKYFGKQKYILEKYSARGSFTKQKQLELWNFGRWMVSGHRVIQSVGLTLLMASPIIRLVNGEITIGTLVFIYTLFLGVMNPLENFAWSLRKIFTAIVDFNSLTQYLDMENEVKDKPNAKNFKVKNGKIHFKNISFKYNKRKIINNLNLEINPNEKIAIIGHSGSGKTTLIKLLYRLYDLNKGEILIDEKNITNVKQESLRNELSIVPQEGILFNDTIENNILFSNPSATKKEIKKALQQAQFYKFVNSLPDKEQTMVGERGIKLSGGEKQRLSIARAILANKKILVLDEATSALDSKTEKDIQIALTKLMQNRTSIIIAHRLSTIMHADKIIVLNKGSIVQTGNHKKLIKEKGIYKELWSLQKGGYLQE
ncbi:MAG: ABC transporter ATP-binding protein [archaeon]|jgi:ATP-binding cassette subfamily B protein